MLVDWYPQAVGLELTLSCPHRCVTCGSDAGLARDRELTVPEWIAVIDELAALGTERITLLGGEPLCHPAWETIARHGTARGVDMEMVTSAWGLDAAMARRIAEAAIASVTVSVDGTESVHDELRRMPGSYQEALGAIRALDEVGIPVGVTTQVNVRTLPVLEQMASELERAGVLGWQIQPTLPTGRAQDTDLVLPAAAMRELYQTLGRMLGRDALCPHATDGFGWFTRDDIRLRTPRGMPPRPWIGCPAGMRALGVTSDGRVKGCLSLPDWMHEGNLLDHGLSEIWRDPERFAYNRRFEPMSLSGPCATCEVGRVCRGGCTAMAVATTGKPNTSKHCLRLYVDTGEKDELPQPCAGEAI